MFLWKKGPSLRMESKVNFEIRHTSAKGRHIVSKCRHSFGEVVLQQEPYAAVLYDDQQTRCQYSFAVVEDLKRYKTYIKVYNKLLWQKNVLQVGRNIPLLAT